MRPRTRARCDTRVAILAPAAQKLQCAQPPPWRVAQIGSAIANTLSAYLLPINAATHGFYYVMGAMVVLGDVLLLFLDTRHTDATADIGPSRPSINSRRSDSTDAVSAVSVCADAGADAAMAAVRLVNDGTQRLLPAVARSEGASESKGGSSRQLGRLLKAWLWDRQYRAFRLVVLSRMIYLTGSQLQLFNYLIFLEDVLGISAAQAGEYIALLSFVQLGTGFAAALPAGLLADRVGLAPCVSVAILGSSAILFLQPQFTAFPAFVAVCAVGGVVGQLFGVVDFALAVATLPDLQRQARSPRNCF